MDAFGWNLSIIALYQLLAALLFSLQPFYGKRAVVFGVSVPVPEVERDLRALAEIRRRFVARTWAAAIAVLAIGVGLPLAIRGAAGIILPLSLFAQVGAFAWVFRSSRQAVLRLQAERGWAAPEPAGRRTASLQTRSSEMTLPNGWFALHVAVAAICAICAAAFWDRIPDTLVTHYGMGGEPDRLSSKSVGFVFLPNMIQLFLVGLFLLVNVAIRHSKLQLDPASPEKSLEKQRRFRRANSVFLLLLSLLLVVVFGIIQGFMIYDWPQQALTALLIAMPLLVLGGVIGFVVYLTNKGLDQQASAVPQDERHWRAGGLFYYNPDDAALFVDKRYGLGWTMNMAKPMSWAILVGILAVPLLIVLLAVLLGG